MNREIKFRAWDMKSKLIREVVDIKFTGKHYYTILLDPTEVAPENWTLRKKDEVVLLQYTGLKDKNGRDIYEGDIIAHGEYYECPEMSFNKIIHAPVIFSDGSFRIHGEPLFQEEVENNETFYVAGNIYQNPELIKQ